MTFLNAIFNRPVTYINITYWFEPHPSCLILSLFNEGAKANGNVLASFKRRIASLSKTIMSRRLRLELNPRLFHSVFRRGYWRLYQKRITSRSSWPKTWYFLKWSDTYLGGVQLSYGNQNNLREVLNKYWSKFGIFKVRKLKTRRAQIKHFGHLLFGQKLKKKNPIHFTIFLYKRNTIQNTLWTIQTDPIHPIWNIPRIHRNSKRSIPFQNEIFNNPSSKPGRNDH